jgi:hypothetical protein
MATSEVLKTPELSESGRSNGRCSAEPRPHLHEALVLLLQGYEYALELGQNVWDFAVELHVLQETRLTNSDLRWLVGMGYVEHALEITGPNDRTRQFRRTPLLTITDSTCLVLSLNGVAAARDVCGGEAVIEMVSSNIAHRKGVVVNHIPHQPRWDCQRRQLKVGADIVKEFKLPSPNQETVLMAFEEEGWPPRIDDPLSPLPQLDPRRRLHDTIKALNRKQKRELIRFMGDGSGEGIRWELTDKAAANSSSAG